MLLASYIVGVAAAALLAAAGILWFNPLGMLARQTLTGARLQTPTLAENSSRLLTGAFALSAVAALLAVLGWFSR